MPQLAPGVVLNDQVVLERELGGGGMGTVWLARHRGLDAAVAVKVLHDHAIDHEESAQRFAREARVVAQIDSPHVVRIYDVGTTHDGQQFIVMELLRGEDLKAQLERMGPLSYERAQLLLRQACAALARAHELGIVHRDIKPANLFLCEGGVDLFVKVVDFGVAKNLWEGDMQLTSTQAVMGTPYYMSPEQFVSPAAVDHRTDLWSMAVVMYACVTGTLPFVAETIGGLSLAVHRGDFAPPRQHRPDLPAALDDWFRRALAPDAAHRFQTADELAQSFATATHAPPTVSPPVAQTPVAQAPVAQPVTQPPARRTPALALALGGLMIAVVAIGATLLWSGIRSSSSDQSAAADDDDRTVSKKKKKKSGKVDLSRMSVEELFKRARSEAQKKHETVELTALSFSDVLPNGELSKHGRFKAYFDTPTWKCINVVITDEVEVDVNKCPKGKRIDLPKCSLDEVRARMKADYPNEPANLIYTRAGNASEASWMLSVAGKGGFLPDDC